MLALLIYYLICCRLARSKPKTFPNSVDSAALFGQLLLLSADPPWEKMYCPMVVGLPARADLCERVINKRDRREQRRLADAAETEKPTYSEKARPDLSLPRYRGLAGAGPGLLDLQANRELTTLKSYQFESKIFLG